MNTPGHGPDRGGKQRLYRLCANDGKGGDYYELLRDRMTLQEAKRIWSKLAHRDCSIIEVQTSVNQDTWLRVFPKSRR